LPLALFCYYVADMKHRALFLVLLIWINSTTFAQAPTPSAPIDYEAIRASRIVEAIRVSEAISLDGVLEEAAWKTTIPATDFIQLTPRPGQQAQQRTEVRFLYDDRNLYVGVTCFQSEDVPLVVNELTQDFNFGQSDALNVILDTLHDRRSAFMFMTNPGGARRDGQIANDGAITNIDWDGVWDVKTSRNAQGWIAEFVIPFKTLRFSKSPTQEWGFNLTRAVRRINEESHWAPIPIRFRPSRISLAGTLRGLENVTQGRNINVKPFVAAGYSDARIGARMETTRSLGRFKDYDGGVDAKYGLTPSLTLDATYRTDFAQVEVDQQQVNLTRFNLFFPEKRDFFLENSGTFNFGPGGNLLPFFSRRIGLSAAGTPIPIIGGARITGRIGQYDTGLLAMKTESQANTPSNNYFVGRVKRNLLRNSWIGGLVTSRGSNREDDHNRVYGSDAHFQFYQKLEFDSYILASNTPGLDGKNQARRFQSAWRDNEFTVGAQYNAVETNFNPEVGFIRRRDNTQYQGEASWSPQIDSSDKVRNLNFGTTIDYYKGGNGKVETRSQEATLGLVFESDASINFTATNTFDRLLTANRIQGIAIPAGDYEYLDYSASFSTDAARKINGGSTLTWGEFWNGRRRSFSANMSVKPNYHLNLTANYNRNYLRLSSGQSTTDLVGARIVYGFSSRSFLNAFLQYNSATREISTNIRFNIMYQPLSDLYVVYNDRRSSTGEPIERAFIVKLTKLFTF
jgi:hypothetical protein